jgi:hypothetical protein
VNAFEKLTCAAVGTLGAVKERGFTVRSKAPVAKAMQPSAINATERKTTFLFFPENHEKSEIFELWQQPKHNAVILTIVGRLDPTRCRNRLMGGSMEKARLYLMNRLRCLVTAWWLSRE